MDTPPRLDYHAWACGRAGRRIVAIPPPRPAPPAGGGPDATLLRNLPVDLSIPLILAAAGFAGGVINALAGGGTLVTFPALIAIGLPLKLGNTTSQVALWPGRLTSVMAQLRDLRRLGAAAWASLAVGLAGGFAGAQLLIVMDPRVFRAMVPWLLLCATVVFALSPTLTRWLVAHGQGRKPPAMRILGRLTEFGFSVYGGFFGAGLGVFLMAGYAIAGIEDVKQTNVLKNMMGMVVTTTSALTFMLRGEVDWPAALPMLAGALAGGFAGGTLARVVPAAVLRALVAAGASGLTAWYFVA